MSEHDNDIQTIVKIRSQYEVSAMTPLDELKRLDSKVKTPAYVFAYIFGTIGALVLGVGMCLAMKVIGGTTPLMIVGIVVGCVGIVMVSITYPIFCKMIASRKAKYRDEILNLSDKLLNK